MKEIIDFLLETWAGGFIMAALAAGIGVTLAFLFPYKNKEE